MLPEAIKMQINTMQNHLPWLVNGTWAEYLSLNYLEQGDVSKNKGSSHAMENKHE
jgi:hypothetical protein